MKYCFIILLLAFSKTSFSQNIKNAEVTELTDKAITKVLGNVERFSVEEAKKLAIRLFVISNGSGSAHVIGDDEISENFLITVSEYDEDPLTKVFSVGPFYGPKIIRKKDFGNTYVITLQQGGNKNLKKHKITISLNNVTCQ